MHERMTYRSMGLAIMLLTLIGSAHAVDIYQQFTMPSGGNPNWGTSAGLAIGYWVPNTPNTAGNVYWVGTMPDGNKPTGAVYASGRMQCRTPNNSTNAAFNGDMLVLSTSATLMMKGTNGCYVQVPQIRAQGFNAPRIECGNAGVMELRGTLLDNQVQLASYLNFAVTDTANQRHIRVTTQITGPGRVRLEGGNCARGFQDHAVILDNNTNDFTGQLYTSNNVKMIINQANAMGNTTTVTLANRAQLFSNVVLNRPTTNLILQGTVPNNALVHVQNNMTWKSIRLLTGQVPPGTKTSAEMATLYPTQFQDDAVPAGSANVTVVDGLPERYVTDMSDTPITTITFTNQNAVWGPALTYDIKIKNVGYQPLVFNPNYNTGAPGVALDAGSNPMYSVVGATPSTATPLAAGASLTVTLRMSGTPADYPMYATTPSTGTLRIYWSNHLGSMNTLTLPIRGTTVPVEMSGFSVK